MSWFKNMKEKLSKQEKRAGKKPPRYIDSNHLHPYYWRCIICQEQAVIAHFPGVLQIAIKHTGFFTNLTPEARQTITDLVALVYKESILEDAEGYEQYKDTFGWAQKRGGSYFYAVYLCPQHADETSKAINASTE